MAAARQRDEWARGAVLTAHAINRNGWTKEAVDPLRLIPPAFRPPVGPVRERTEKELEEESRLAWALLDRAFGGGPSRD